MDASVPASTKRDRVLVIDGDPSARGVIEELVRGHELEIRSATAGSSGLEQLRQWRPDVVLLNDRLPDQPGLGVLQQIFNVDPHVPVLFVAADGAAENAIEAIRQGAFDYFTMPLPVEQLRQSIQQARENRQLMRAPVVVGEASAPDQDPDRLIGRCEAMQRVYKAIGRIAAHDQPALIVGPPGVGKRLVARAIHQHGARSSGPFVSIRCGDHQPDDLESLLFLGTDAQPAAVSQARGGILLLEEFEMVSWPLQARLLGLVRQALSAAQLNSAEPPGAVLLLSLGIDADHLVPALHQTENRLPQHLRVIRPDLYYELAGNTIVLPPLHKRGDDIRLLVEHYVQRLSSSGRVLSDVSGRISSEAIELVYQYDWPGNITELKSVLRRAMLESRGTIIASDYLRQALGESSSSEPVGRTVVEPSSAAPTGTPAPVRRAAPPGQTDWDDYIGLHLHDDSAAEPALYAAAVEQMERGLIAATLRRTQGNLAQAARLLGMTRVSLRKKILKLDLAVPGR